MKKTGKIALSVAALLIVFGLLFCAIAVTQGADLVQLWENGAFSVQVDSVNYGLWGDAGYAVCEDGELSFDPEEVWSLDLSWVAGSVSVESYDGNTLLLREECARELREGQRMRWKLSGQTLSVRYCASGESKVPAKQLTVLVPNGWAREEVTVDATSADVSFKGLRVNETLSADVTSGKVRVSGCSASGLRVNTTSGNVEIEDAEIRGTAWVDTTSGTVGLRQLTCGKLDADTTSGNIDFEGLASEIDVDTTSGRVSLQGLPDDCAVNVDTVSGDVSLQFAGTAKKVTVDTTSGTVRLSFPEGTGLDLDYDTVSGRLSGDVQHDSKGGVPVRVNTVSGDLRVEYE